MSERPSNDLYEADIIIVALLLAREAERSADPDAFLDELDAMFAPLFESQEVLEAFTSRIAIARMLLQIGRTGP